MISFSILACVFTHSKKNDKFYSFTAKEIEHDSDTQSEDCYVAMEALCEVYVQISLTSRLIWTLKQGKIYNVCYNDSRNAP